MTLSGIKSYKNSYRVNSIARAKIAAVRMDRYALNNRVKMAGQSHSMTRAVM